MSRSVLVQEGWKDTLSREKSTWRIPWMEESGRLQSMGLRRVGHAGEKRGVAGLLLGRTERAARAAELQLCAQAR